jgi:hypothetical protein
MIPIIVCYPSDFRLDDARSGAMGGEQFQSIVAIIGGVLCLILIILWVILPFIVMGMSRRLDRLIELVSVNNEISLESNRLLDKLASEVEDSLK